MAIAKSNFEYVLSLDVGGANTKFSLLYLDVDQFISSIDSDQGIRYKKILQSCEHLISDIEYFPFWEKKTVDFSNVLKRIKKLSEEKIKERNNNKICQYSIILTITAELSDAFNTKKEGITTICNAFRKIFNEPDVKIIDVNGNFLTIDQAIDDYLNVSASNWVATSLVLGEKEKLGILLDMGSTTLDLIPIKDGQPVTIGKNDTDRLINYELFYSGILRAPIPTIAQNVSFRNMKCPISFENFAIMADVYLILDKISPEQYSCDTPDGRPKTKEYSYARLSRVICGDPDLIEKEELDEIAQNLFNQHKELIKQAIQRSIDQFIRRFITPTAKIRFNITGLGAHILIEPALHELNIRSKQIFYRSLSDKEHIVSTAICLGTVFLKKTIVARMYPKENA